MTTKISGSNISSIANTGVNWNAVTVADGSTQLNASAGNGYILDTNTGVIEVFLPSSPTRGDTVILVDYAGTFATNNVIVNTGGTLLDSTSTVEYKLTTNDTIAEFVYIDSAKGWITKINTTAGTTPSGVFNVAGGYDTIPPEFIAATGGTVTTSGDFKIHTFTGDGCFVVSQVGNPQGSDAVDYLVVAGGGGGGASQGVTWGGSSGGGAGGYRESSGAASGCYSASPLGSGVSALPVSTTTYPITVGGGGSGGPGPNGPSNGNGARGSNSVFSTITSTGGGGGRSSTPGRPSADWPGGSGGGGTGGNFGSGNTPPVAPPQGNNGGAGAEAGPAYAMGGGGGATAAGQGNAAPNLGNNGGAGATTSISASPTAYAGGGGSGAASGNTAGTGGTGGGANGASGPGNGSSAIANRGGGGGGAGGVGCCAVNGGSGGKGIVIVRYKFQ